MTGATHRQDTLPPKALLQIRQRLIVSHRTSPKLLKHPPLLRVPIASLAILKDPVELLLCLLPRLLYRRDDVLFVCMTQVARDVGVLEGLQGRECRRGIEVRDRASESRRIDVCLRQ